MATTSDDATVINKLLFYIDQNFSGIDHYGLPVFAKIEPSDFQLILAAYATYKQARLSRATVADASGQVHYATELFAASHGVQGTTYATGNTPVLPAGNPVEPAHTPPSWPQF